MSIACSASSLAHSGQGEQRVIFFRACSRRSSIYKTLLRQKITYKNVKLIYKYLVVSKFYSQRFISRLRRRETKCVVEFNHLTRANVNNKAS